MSSSAVATRSTRAPAPGSDSAKPNTMASLVAPSWSSVQLQVALAHQPRQPRCHAGQREQRFAVRDAKRCQARQLLRERHVEILEHHLRIDLDGVEAMAAELAPDSVTNASRKSSSLSGAMLIPAAPAWPPNLVSRPAQRASAS